MVKNNIFLSCLAAIIVSYMLYLLLLTIYKLGGAFNGLLFFADILFLIMLMDIIKGSKT